MLSVNVVLTDLSLGSCKSEITTMTSINNFTDTSLIWSLALSLHCVFLFIKSNFLLQFLQPFLVLGVCCGQ